MQPHGWRSMYILLLHTYAWIPFDVDIKYRMWASRTTNQKLSFLVPTMGLCKSVIIFLPFHRLTIVEIISKALRVAMVNVWAIHLTLVIYKICIAAWVFEMPSVASVGLSLASIHSLKFVNYHRLTFCSKALKQLSCWSCWLIIKVLFFSFQATVTNWAVTVTNHFVCSACPSISGRTICVTSSFNSSNRFSSTWLVI